MTAKKTDREMVTESYSSYWLDNNVNYEEDGSSVERIVRLSSIRRAIANFVRILTNDDTIQVKFSSGQKSFTDGKTVYISADDSPDKFDTTVGLALHEGSHCLLSNFEFLKSIMGNEYVCYGAMHPKLQKMFHVNKFKSEQEFLDKINAVREYIKHIMNVIEDRRIDSYVYQNAPGYRPYYDSLYSKFFLAPDIIKNMKFNPEWREVNVENYINWLIMIISPDFTTKALPGLKKMVDIIDLNDIRRLDASTGPTGSSVTWKIERMETNKFTHFPVGIYSYDQFSLLWKLSNEIMIEILKHVKHQSLQNPSSVPQFTDDIDVFEDGEDFDGEVLPNYDFPVGRFSKEKGKKAMDKIKEIMDGKDRRKKVTKKEIRDIESMETADATIVENSDSVFGKVPCLVTRRIHKSMLLDEWFPFSRSSRYGNKTEYLEDISARAGVVAGMRMGQILAHRLQVRNDPTITHFTRQPHGKIDRRILSQLGMDITSVFKRTTLEHFHPAMLHLSIDASGSMGGIKWQKAITVATALAYASEKIRNLDVVVTIRGNVSGGMPIVCVVFDSRVDTFRKAQALFPYLSPANSTPEGLCYLATMDLIKECADTHRTYFINFSDGEPGHEFSHNRTRVLYSGEKAIRQTKNMVNQIREAGIEVMSYFIGYGDNVSSYGGDAFKKMYGQTAQFVSVQNVTQVLKTLNKLLLTHD